jgi:hypothetical protein
VGISQVEWVPDNQDPRLKVSKISSTP